MALAFLLLAAGLAVTEAAGSALKLLLATRASCRHRVADRPEPQASGQTSVPGEVGVTHWDQADRTNPVSPGWCPGKCLNTYSGDVSRVYVVKQKNLPLF